MQPQCDALLALRLRVATETDDLRRLRVGPLFGTLLGHWREFAALAAGTDTTDLNAYRIYL